MTTQPFIGFHKMGRFSREVIVTEKIDGTNAQRRSQWEDTISGQSGQYIVTAPSRFDLTHELRQSIHEEAVAAYKNGKQENANPYAFGCPAFLQWEHSYEEWKESAESYYEN